MAIAALMALAEPAAKLVVTLQATPARPVGMSGPTGVVAGVTDQAATRMVHDRGGRDVAAARPLDPGAGPAAGPVQP